MATKRMENWDAGDFCKNFRHEAQSSSDDLFREKLNALADAIEPMNREFCEETVRCGRDLSSVMEELQSIAARMGYCSKPRGFGRDCASLYDDMKETIRHVETLRSACFV